MRAEQYALVAELERDEATQPSHATPGIACRASIAAMLLWSLVETYWDLLYPMGKIHIAIILFTKLIIAGIALAAMCGSFIALAACAFFCVVSIVVIGVTLPDLYTLSRTFFYLSLVEVVVKTTAAVSISFYCAEDHVTRDLDACNWQMR
ncbi:hypothetical protein [Paraburkholderia hospita]|uniref:Uncharacterized protein n=1 Tax=Paraburkholderia hospita TaxID=169430 RepID=A0AAN1MNL6_9BURK|nr:hypothetical protein [Paraburkholderia hospita]AYC79736.1 hypothetical protein [uncultured bacterium]AUT73556.1 hypothetical protein C2L64_34955 [Paraburkholderia hospita]EIM99055.1 hypothetical protein WQE_21806 [Paraburkholderia hospita]OUL75098.1 hypothetical protein CA602_37690 [Paraburkholderia hospita]OUL94444.1 hypothetical protein CA601_07740 [Paraburkholderia hospita]